jgi:phosphatidylglycerol:prolipoprotein diacylglycerol transferase
MVVDGVPRHATQLYEAALEGLLLFSVLWVFTRKPRPQLAPSGLFLILYGCARVTVEFWRVPDVQIGYLAGDWLTMGHLLSLPMVLSGVVMMWYAYRRPTPSGNFAVAPAR